MYPEDLEPSHQCRWKEEVRVLQELLADKEAQLAELEQKLQAVLRKMQDLERRLFGPKRERMPKVEPVDKALLPDKKDPTRKEQGRTRRRERQALREKLQTQTVFHPVPEQHKRCPHCGNTDLSPLGNGKTTHQYEYIPGYFIRYEHIQQKLSCRCGRYIVTAEPPVRPTDKGHYGPGLHAHVVVMKCADSLPLHRLAKQYSRLGIAVGRSTLCDLFHATAQKLEPLSERLLQQIASAEVVQADETPLKMLSPERKAYVWTFLSGNLIGYRFSQDRSGQTPQQVLGGTKGTLVVDAYTGYNRVTKVEGRQRAGCLAHARRKFFEALPTAPKEAKQALELILDVYRVEHAAKESGIVRTKEHLELRKTQGRKAMERLKAWLQAEQGKHPPKSPLGEAIQYALNQWQPLNRFLEDEQIPIGRVEHWRGGLRKWGVAVADRFRVLRRCLVPLHRSVSSARSSNRACGFPALGSPPMPHAFAFGRLKSVAGGL